ncbi:hypothetical protein [Aureispira anguillae]|uniref:Uncharacterized protein n=1 Tax=Aureispira anguillae TaxID=2864201 RepID=A0A915YBT4_9BACT|nr:hypothetical protein [Aureispira anguillae]BDS10187.1 hypothetical protein AsAng_0008950 [Aureispira anguillae]
MPTNIKGIWMILQTATGTNSGIKDSNHLELQITTTNSVVKLETNNAASGANGLVQSLVKAQATQFSWNAQGGYWPAGALTVENISSWSLELVAANSNASYTPRCIWIIMRDVDNNYHLAVADRSWNKNKPLLPGIAQVIG